MLLGDNWRGSQLSLLCWWLLCLSLLLLLFLYLSEVMMWKYFNSEYWGMSLCNLRNISMNSFWTFHILGTPCKHTIMTDNVQEETEEKERVDVSIYQKTSQQQSWCGRWRHLVTEQCQERCLLWRVSWTFQFYISLLCIYFMSRCIVCKTVV